MSGGDIRYAVLFKLFGDRFARLRGYTLMPKALKQTVAEIAAVVCTDIYVAYRRIIGFQADGIIIGYSLFVLPIVFFFKKAACPIKRLQRKPGQKCVYLCVAENTVYRVYIVFAESS